MAMVLEFQPSLVTMAMPSVCAVVAVICDGGPCTSMVYWRAILPILRCAAEEDQRCGMIKIGHLKKSSGDESHQPFWIRFSVMQRSVLCSSSCLLTAELALVSNYCTGSLTCQLRRLIRTNVYPEDNMAHALEKLSVAQLLALGLQKAGYDIRTECGSCAEAWMKWALANQETLALEEVMGVLELRELVIVSDVCPVPEEIPRGGCDKLSILDLAWSTAFTSSFTSERREPGRQALARIMSLHCNVLMWINAASKQMSTQEELLAIARSCQSSIHRCISDSHELVRAAAISVTPLVTLGIGAAKHCLTRSLA